VYSINVNCGWQETVKTLDFELRLDAPDGKLLGKGSMPSPKKGQQSGTANIPVASITDGQLHTIYILYHPKEPVKGSIVSVRFNGK